jgi:hypothetical protein
MGRNLEQSLVFHLLPYSALLDDFPEFRSPLFCRSFSGALLQANSCGRQLCAACTEGALSHSDTAPWLHHPRRMRPFASSAAVHVRLQLPCSRPPTALSFSRLRRMRFGSYLDLWHRSWSPPVKPVSVHCFRSHPLHWALLRDNCCARQLRVFCFSGSSQQIF